MFAETTTTSDCLVVIDFLSNAVLSTIAWYSESTLGAA